MVTMLFRHFRWETELLSKHVINCVITPAMKYKAFQRICSIMGSSEEKIATVIRSQATKGMITVRTTNAETGLVFSLTVNSFSTGDEYRVRLYECYADGNVEIMACEIRLTRPPRIRTSGKPGLSEIVGAIAVIAVVVGAGTAFFFSTLDRVNTNAAENAVDIHALRLTAYVPDGGETDTVHAEIVLSVLYEEDVKISGGVSEMTLFDGTYTDAVTSEGDGLIIQYSGIVDLESSKGVGDTVEIIIQYGNHSRTAVSEIVGR